MSRLILWILCGAVFLLVASFWAFPVGSGEGMSAVIAKSLSNARAVAFAATRYAEGHEGRLPSSLQNLVPDYLPATFPLKHFHLATPGLLLAELPPETVIVFGVATDTSRGTTRVIVARVDGNGEQRLP